jgi:hypothetical protein
MPQQVEAKQEEDDNPDQHAVRRGVDKREAQAREFMASVPTRLPVQRTPKSRLSSR